MSPAAIIQNRFFKRENGESTRKWLRSGEWIHRIEDFRDTQVFPGRTTCTTLLILQAGSRDTHDDEDD